MYENEGYGTCTNLRQRAYFVPNILNLNKVEFKYESIPPFLEQKTLIEFGRCPNYSGFIRRKFFFKHALVGFSKNMWQGWRRIKRNH